MVHHEAGLLYLAHPRTASTATEQALLRLGFTDPAPALNKHTRREDLPDPFEGFGVATTVRNHFDALVSWHYLQRYGFHFGCRYIRRMIADSEYLSVHALYGLHLDEADTVLRYETLEGDLERWVGRPVELPRVHVSHNREGRPYREFFDGPTRRYVEGMFCAEMERLDYGWDA